MIKLFLKNWFVIVVSILALFVYLPFYYQFSQDLGSSSILSEDQQAYISNIFRILYPEKFESNGYWNNFLIFAYGPLFWVFPVILALPFKLVEFEPGVLLAIYFVPFVCFVGIIYVLSLIYKLVNFIEENWFYKSLVILSTSLCLLVPVIIGNTFQIRAEIVLSFFSILSFYFLLKDNNNFSRNYYLSVSFFCISICIKLLSVLVGVMFLLYFIYNHKKLTLRIIANSVCLLFVIVAISYLPLWLDGGISGYANDIVYASSITLTGWPQDHVVVSYKNSVNFFDNIYLNFYALSALLSSAVVVIIYKFKSKNIYFIAAFFVVLIYLIYTIFVVFMPNNYGILVPIFTAALIILMVQEVAHIENAWLKNLLLVILCIFIVSLVNNFIKNRIWNCLKVELSPLQEKVMKAQNNVKDFLTYNDGQFKHPCIDKQLSILKVNGMIVNHSSFGELSLNDELMTKCDIFIFWDESRVSGFLVAKKGETETNEMIKNTQTNYQKILKNSNLIYNENDIRIFQKTISKHLP